MQLARSLRVCVGIADVLENNWRYRNLSPYCEPQLGKRNLYRSTGGESIGTEINARLWVLNFSDGENTLLDIAERSGLPFAAIHNAAESLCQSGLLSAIADREPSEAAPAGSSHREVSAGRRAASAATAKVAGAKTQGNQ